MSLDPWTLVLQALNVLVLIWLLQRVLWRPVAGMIAARKAETQATLDAVAARQAEAEAALADIAATRAGFEAERDAILAAARRDAAAATQMAAKAADEAAEATREAAEVAGAHAAADRAAARDAASAALAVDIARRLLDRVDEARVQEAFLDRLVAALGAMSPEARRVAALDGAALELITAAPLTPEARTRAEARIAAVTDGTPRLAFRTDPALVAGAELSGPHFTLRDSWRADLARIETELRHAR